MLLSTKQHLLFYFLFTFLLPLVNLINKYIKIAKEANLSVIKIKSYPSKGIANKAIITATKNN